MKIIIVDNGSRHLTALANICKLYGQVSIIPLSQINQIVDSPNTILILSGGHSKSVVGHKKLYANEIKLIKNTKMPIIGVCLGFELIALTYHNSLTPRTQRLHRLVKIIPTLNSTVFDKVGPMIVFQSHKWMVKTTADPLLEIARSKSEVEIFKHKSKPIYGLQFHPEVHIGRNNGDRLFNNIIGILKNSIL